MTDGHIEAKALNVRIESNGRLGGTEVYDAADGCRLSNVIAVRFEHRIEHIPVVILELRGGALLLTDTLLGVAETRGPEAR